MKKVSFAWDFIGQKSVVDFLESAVINRKLHHAYVFFGPSGLGKFTLAKKFAASFFCRTAGNVLPCGDCHDCKQMEIGLHPDVYFVSRAADEKTGKMKKDIAVEQIRDMKARLQQATLLGGYKAAIIDEAQHLNANAANALLKVLEEPTQKTVIILITDDLSRLPKTVLSRCQVLKFLPVSPAEIESSLSDKRLARLSFGRPGLAISFLRNKEKLESYLNRVRLFFELLPLDLNRRFDLIESVEDGEISGMLGDWQNVLRDLILLKTDNEDLAANLDFIPALKKYSGIFSFSKLKAILNQLKLSQKRLEQNISPKNVLENLMVNL